MSPRVLALCAVAVVLAVVGGAGRAASNTVFPGGSTALTDCCNNSGAITGAPSTAATYPLTINVNSGPLNVGHIAVTVSLDAQWPDDVRLLLVNPSGSAKVVLMANAGGDNGNAISPDTLVFDDAGASIPDNVQLKDGTYHPTALSDASDCDNQATPNPLTTSFPATAPAQPYTSALSAFFLTGAQGLWKLYAIDDCNLANVGGSIVSWSLDIVMPSAVQLRSFTASRSVRGAQIRWRTAVETDALGFNVYRFAHGSKAKVNRTLIAAKRSGTVHGAAYSLLDWHAVKGAFTYRLQVVTVRGSRSWLATAALRARR
jgi:hypothetical protein